MNREKDKNGTTLIIIGEWGVDEEEEETVGGVEKNVKKELREKLSLYQQIITAI